MVKIKVHNSIHPIGPTVMKATFKTAAAKPAQPTHAGIIRALTAASEVETMNTAAGRVATQTIIA
jgi:hypothetical protein